MKLPLVVPATVCSAVIALGVFQNAWTARYTRTLEPQVLRDRLAHVPLRIGNWDGVDQTATLPEGVPEVIGPTIVHRYVDRQSGAVVLLSITADRPGPLFVNHQPTDCYPGIGYDLAAGPSKRTISLEDGSANFWTAQFTNSHGAAPRSVRIYWSFSGDGDWQAPRSPRITFARYPCVYKLYVIRQMRRADDLPEKEPLEDFIRAAAPALKKALFQPAA